VRAPSTSSDPRYLPDGRRGRGATSGKPRWHSCTQPDVHHCRRNQTPPQSPTGRQRLTGATGDGPDTSAGKPRANSVLRHHGARLAAVEDIGRSATSVEGVTALANRQRSCFLRPTYRPPASEDCANTRESGKPAPPAAVPCYASVRHGPLSSAKRCGGMNYEKGCSGGCCSRDAVGGTARWERVGAGDAAVWSARRGGAGHHRGLRNHRRHPGRRRHRRKRTERHHPRARRRRHHLR
jgi:hypothetical protein